MRPASPIKFRRAPEGNSPWVVLPTGLIVLETLFVVWLAVFLGLLAADEQLSPELADSPPTILIFVMFGGIAPVVAAYALSTNQRWARSVSFIAVLGVLAVIGYYFGIYLGFPIAWLSVCCIAVAVAVVWYLFRSRAALNYTALINGKSPPFPELLDSQETVSTSPAQGGKLQLVLEYAAILVGLSIVVAAVRVAMGQ